MGYKGFNLAGLARALREMTRVPSLVSTTYAEWVTAELQSGYDTGMDAYGNPWAALKPATIRRKGHARINIESGGMQGGTRAFPMSGAGVAMTALADHAHFPFHGTENHPPRPQLPHKGLPPKWREELQRQYTERVRQTMSER